MLILSLGGADRPFLLVNDVAKVVQLAGWDRISKLDDLPVGASKPDHPAVGRIGRERVEAGSTDMPPDLLKISARGAPSAEAEIEDEPIDVREHVRIGETAYGAGQPRPVSSKT